LIPTADFNSPIKPSSGFSMSSSFHSSVILSALEMAAVPPESSLAFSSSRRRFSASTCSSVISVSLPRSISRAVSTDICPRMVFMAMRWSNASSDSA
jgi:hypothetical protein